MTDRSDQQDRTHDILEVVREQVFNLPLMPQQDVLRFFDELDGTLDCSINLLLERSHYVERYLADVVSEVAASTTHGRTIYGRDSSEEDDDPVDPEDEHDPAAVFKRSSDVRFLEQGINIMHLLALYDQVGFDEAARYKPQARAVLRNVNFVRLVYEEAIEMFLYNVDGYIELARQAANVHNAMHATRHKAEFVNLAQQYAGLHDEMAQVEESVGVDRTFLFHVCSDVEKYAERHRKIRDRIAQPYLRIVYKEAKNHATNSSQLLDNFQNGSMGLMRAVSCYNLHRNVSFSSYAHWWIRQAILYHIKDSSNFVKLPVTTWQTFTAIEKKRAKLVSETGETSMEALAEAAECTVSKLEEIYDAVRSSHVHSLDYEVDESGKMLLIDVIADQSHEDIDNLDAAKREVVERFKHLEEEERWVLTLTYGLMGMLQHRAELADVSILHERIRQRIAGSHRN